MLPIVVKKYKTKSSSDCIVRKIRANSIYQYNDEGYIKDHNPNNLLFRNEKNKGFYLKEQQSVKRRYGGGTTGVFVEDTEGGGAVVMTIAYYGLQQSLIIIALICGILYTSVFNQDELFKMVGIAFLFNLIIGYSCRESLQRQRKLVESIIDSCIDGV